MGVRAAACLSGISMRQRDRQPEPPPPLLPPSLAPVSTYSFVPIKAPTTVSPLRVLQCAGAYCNYVSLIPSKCYVPQRREYSSKGVTPHTP